MRLFSFLHALCLNLASSSSTQYLVHKWRSMKCFTKTAGGATCNSSCLLNLVVYSDLFFRRKHLFCLKCNEKVLVFLTSIVCHKWIINCKVKVKKFESSKKFSVTAFIRGCKLIYTIITKYKSIIQTIFIVRT